MTNLSNDREVKDISLHSKEIQKIFSNIRKIRMMKGFSQQNIADELGINQKHYSKIENGYVDISITRLFQIAKALNTSVTDLIGLSEDKVFNNIINNQHSEGYKFYYATEIDQIKELYERLLKEKDEIINILKEKKM